MHDLVFMTLVVLQYQAQPLPEGVGAVVPQPAHKLELSHVVHGSC